MRRIPDLYQPITQADLAHLLGRSEGRVSQWATEGTLPPGGTGLEWLRAVVDRLSAEAAGRYSAGELDLAQERAALARAQREGVEMRNGVQRGEFVRATLLAEVLATASQAVAQGFDHLPGRLRKACPDLPPAATDEVMSVIATARNEWVRNTVSLVAASLEVDDDDKADDDTEPGDNACRT